MACAKKVKMTELNLVWILSFGYHILLNLPQPDIIHSWNRIRPTKGEEIKSMLPLISATRLAFIHSTLCRAYCYTHLCCSWLQRPSIIHWNIVYQRHDKELLAGGFRVAVLFVVCGLRKGGNSMIMPYSWCNFERSLNQFQSIKSVFV